MNEFLQELKELLIKHQTVIIRSANSTRDLVISKHIGGTEFKEIAFNEDITMEAIQYGWFKELN